MGVVYSYFFTFLYVWGWAEHHKKKQLTFFLIFLQPIWLFFLQLCLQLLNIFRLLLLWLIYSLYSNLQLPYPYNTCCCGVTLPQGAAYVTLIMLAHVHVIEGRVKVYRLQILVAPDWQIKVIYISVRTYRASGRNIGKRAQFLFTGGYESSSLASIGCQDFVFDIIEIFNFLLYRLRIPTSLTP